MNTTRSFDVDNLLEAISDVAYGTVNWFDTERGFGFVTPTEGNHDVFVDSSEIADALTAELHAGQRVSYRTGGTPHWPMAEAVQVL